MSEDIQTEGRAESVQEQEKHSVPEEELVGTNPADEGDDAEKELDWEQESNNLRTELQSATREHERLASMYSRLRADFDNFRRRKDQEIASLKTTASANLIQSLLPIVDNLERAVASAGEGEGPLAEGVRLVLRQFMQALHDHGVEPIVSIGQPFDPNFHEAVDRVDDLDDVEAGTIVDELQKGYRMGDLVLRPSIVRVAG